MINYKEITQEKFNEFINAKHQLRNDYTGAFYPFQSIKTILIYSKEENQNKLKKRLTNRNANFIFEETKNKIYYVLIKVETKDQYLSVKRLLTNLNFKNRCINLFFSNNIFEFTNENKSRNKAKISLKKSD